ncbi:MAG: hypothetical protein WB785_21995 [Mycobacterium sp.]|uniref:hypothetical protein n=1 Tax=Mycobacterium sp. TaxID=1785 RepID=UPI003C4E481B
MNTKSPIKRATDWALRGAGGALQRYRAGNGLLGVPERRTFTVDESESGRVVAPASHPPSRT